MKVITLIKDQIAFDNAGIILSTICLIHCIMLPLALTTTQLLGVQLIPHSPHGFSFHMIMAVVLLGVGSIAFIQGYRKHKHKLPLIGGIIGTLLLFISAFGVSTYFSHLENIHGWLERGPTLLGTFILISSHIKNRQCLKQPCQIKECACPLD